MRQPLQFFEKSENCSGAITHILSSDVKAINNATIDFVIMFFHGVSVTIFSIILCSFIYVWPSIATVIIMPVFILALVLNNNIQGKNFLRETEHCKKENMIVSD